MAMSEEDLRGRIVAYVTAHHTMTVATMGVLDTTGLMDGQVVPHAASVFYAADRLLRLIFLSKPTSIHGFHIGEAGPVAATVTEPYADWEMIQGVQLWGEARLLAGKARLAAMTIYVARFPFVKEMMKQPKLGELIRNIGVYRITPHKVAFTDNTTGAFGREVLEWE